VWRTRKEHPQDLLSLEPLSKGQFPTSEMKSRTGNLKMLGALTF
jgi:hypothetical protein